MSGFELDRRNFIRTGVTFCGLCACSGLPALAGSDEGERAVEPIDPAKLNYCGYTCPPDCKFLTGTLEANDELKREAFKLWKLEERFGIEFDPSTAICYGCKNLDKPEGEVLSRCTVRSCAQEKKHASCIQCDELAACDKDLWRRFPGFKAQVVDMQKQYRAQA